MKKHYQEKIEMLFQVVGIIDKINKIKYEY